MKKRILGLDIGVASIGWSLVEVEEISYPTNEKLAESEYKLKINDGKIVDMGVRTFQQPIDRNKKSLALNRGEKRRLRATLERRAERMNRLSDFEFFRVLYHIAKHRGF